MKRFEVTFDLGKPRYEVEAEDEEEEEAIEKAEEAFDKDLFALAFSHYGPTVKEIPPSKESIKEPATPEHDVL